MEDEATAEVPLRLLSLPPELRNRIYRYALIADNGIVIQHQVSTPTIPSLLATCHQVRHEAYDIYFKENDFRFYITDFDATLLLRWCKTFGRSRISLVAQPGKYRLFTRMSSPPAVKWQNLIVWLKASFRGRCIGLARDDQAGGSHPNCNAASALFKMIHDMRRETGVTWIQAKAALDGARVALAALNPAWAA